MSKEEQLEMREILNKALKESYHKMIDLKKKLGQTVIIADGNGQPIEVSAEEAERIAHAQAYEDRGNVGLGADLSFRVAEFSD
ncbi:MAG: hypothetical protein K2K75_08910 [Muribaculaceae bacterium]|nr:hypothetical protein [Muribaculaceae bacterium]